MMMRIILLLVPIFLFSAESALLKPQVKSLILPGWGERSLQAEQRGLVFTGIETGILILTGLGLVASDHYDADLRSHAARHAGISGINAKDDLFLDTIADYDNMQEYNDQMLRNRRSSELYFSEKGESWDWESDALRLEYQDIKLSRYRWDKIVEFSLGAVVLNHLVSSMDALYLQRIQADLSVVPELGPGSTGLSMVLRF